MIGIAPWEPIHFLFCVLIAWAAIKAAPYARPLKSWHHWRWTIADWFDTVFWISVALAIIFGIGRS